MDYAQDLENRICRMRRSFFELLSHVEKAGIQPDLSHELQKITRDFLSASQITEPFNKSESQRGGGHTNYNHSRADPNSPRPVVFTGNYTACTTAPVPIEMPMPVPLPRNFAQWLYFSCIKRAHGLLTDPSADRTEVARVFQHSFRYSDANNMISTLDILLRTNVDYQTAHVYRLGGAGTHYKNRQTDVGVVQNIALGQQSPVENNDGPWFDPRDIEGWIEENGLAIGGAVIHVFVGIPFVRTVQRHDSSAIFRAGYSAEC